MSTSVRAKAFGIWLRLKTLSASPRTSTTAYALMPLPHPVVKAMGMSSAPTTPLRSCAGRGAPVRLWPDRSAEPRSNVPDAPVFPGVAQRGALQAAEGAAERARSVSGQDPCAPPFADRTRAITLSPGTPHGPEHGYSDRSGAGRNGRVRRGRLRRLGIAWT